MRFTDVLFAIFLVLGTLFFLWYVFGNSPTLDQTLLLLIVGLVIKMYGEFKEFKGDYGSFKKNVESSFKNMKEDFKRMKR